MRVPIKMPKLGLTMSEGTIVSWFKSVGEGVKKGEILFEIMTEKITKEIESPYDGVLVEIVIDEGQTVPVGEVIGYMEVEGVEEARVEAVVAEENVIKEEEKESIVKESHKVTVRKEKEGVKASPRARKKAEELGVDIGAVSGSGPGGRVVEKDVIEFAASSKVEGGNVVELKGVRKVIASRMQESFRDKPHFSLEISVDASYLIYKKGELERERGGKVSYTALLIYYLGKVLRDYPLLNAVFISEEAVEIFDSVNVNVAVDTPSGLMVPVVKNIEKKNIFQIAEELEILARKARNNELDMTDVEGGTVTLTNLGMFGIQRFTAVINPPQTAIIAVGAIENKVLALDTATFTVKPMFTATLVADHRIVDGAYGARFLSKFKAVLEDREK